MKKAVTAGKGTDQKFRSDAVIKKQTLDFFYAFQVPHCLDEKDTKLAKH